MSSKQIIPALPQGQGPPELVRHVSLFQLILVLITHHEMENDIVNGPMQFLTAFLFLIFGIPEAYAQIRVFAQITAVRPGFIYGCSTRVERPLFTGLSSL